MMLFIPFVRPISRLNKRGLESQLPNLSELVIHGPLVETEFTKWRRPHNAPFTEVIGPLYLHFVVQVGRSTGVVKFNSNPRASDRGELFCDIFGVAREIANGYACL